MNQLSLDFEAPLARSGDRQTSHDGADHIETRIAGKRAAALRSAQLLYARLHSPATAREIAEQSAVSHGGEVESYRKRCLELVRCGALVECDPRVCGVTGRRAITYRPRSERSSC